MSPFVLEQNYELKLTNKPRNASKIKVFVRVCKKKGFPDDCGDLILMRKGEWKIEQFGLKGL